MSAPMRVIVPGGGDPTGRFWIEQNNWPKRWQRELQSRSSALAAYEETLS